MRKHGSGLFLKAITLFGIAVFALSACGGGSDDVAAPASPANLTAGAPASQRSTATHLDLSGHWLTFVDEQLLELLAKGQSPARRRYRPHPS